jgi:hypothetical protein
MRSFQKIDYQINEIITSKTLLLSFYCLDYINWSHFKEWFKSHRADNCKAIIHKFHLPEL